MNKYPSPDDLRVFMTVARNSSFVRAADEMGVSSAYVTKRVHVLEATIGTKLLHRTTRKVSLTESGDIVYEQAQRILGSLDKMVEEADPLAHEPKGYLRICSSFGFGRNLVAPAIAQLVARYAELEVRFEVLDRVVDPVANGFDLDVRVGDDIAPHLVARRLANNHRILCASPDYIERNGLPKTINDLKQHNCLVIKERDHPFGFGILKLAARRKQPRSEETCPPITERSRFAGHWTATGSCCALSGMSAL